MSRRHEPNRHVDLGCEELLRELRPPDLRARVRASGASHRRRAADRVAAAKDAFAGAESQRRGRSSSAMVFVGSSLVAGLVWLQTDPVERNVGQDTSTRLVIPKDEAAFLEMLQNAKSARLRSIPLSETRGGVHVDGEDGKKLARAMAGGARTKLDVDSFHFRGDEHQLEFHLGGNEVIRLRVWEAAGDVIGAAHFGGAAVQFVVANPRMRSVGQNAMDLLQPFLDRLPGQTPTRVRGRDALLMLIARERAANRSGERTVVDHLAAERLAAEDLELLKGLPSMRTLDLVKSGVAEDGVVRVSNRKQLRALVLSAGQIGGRGAWLDEFQNLSTLRVVNPAWTEKFAMYSAKCALCHRVAGRQQPRPPAGSLRGLTATRRIRHLELIGLEVDKDFGELLEGLPFLETLDLSGCDLSNLSFSVFRKLSSLRRLVLDGCVGVEESRLEELTSLRWLRSLGLVGLPVDAARRLRAKLPKCDVRF